MSELTITLLRLGYLVLLWAFVLSAISVLRRDLYGTKIVNRRRPGAAKAPAAPPPPPAGADRAAPIPRRDVGPRRLVVTQGPLRGTTVPLSGSQILIGRAPSCTLVLDDDYSSSRHARIFSQDGQWMVEDLGSTNGTFLGRERVQGPTVVQAGSQVRVGQSTLELQR
ncbi:FHA domain-containing protein FhaB/FipA [Cellulomonas bogoriensis]|uniref:Signal peptide protein n=1 Tax=Cellulomonas bogoriensis 69B4 = DSM 16987 TaxID=1386082 RepID=A0A0A0C1F3_9CELL|nr:FHA domain-containing protein [Cellulomonas bogoriensis]KGM13752.1 signal peptide protein [Cellulomonas bogoriensis 69B4 = DSM 16987]